MPKKPSLAETHPELAKQWHPTKNRNLKLNDLTYGSSKPVWWICDKGSDHQWLAPIKRRIKGARCPYCTGRYVSETNSLKTLYPDLANSWHPKLNGDLRPEHVTTGSEKKVWWICPQGDDHEWKASVKSRTRGNGCPVCHGLKVVKSNSLGLLKPEIAKLWHPIRNKQLSPYDVTPNSSVKVWWKCPEGPDHVWENRPAELTVGKGCPFCAGKRVSSTNSLAALYPDLTKEWYQLKNGSLTPHDVVSGSNKKVWWKCPKQDDHIYKAMIQMRAAAGTGCPMCRGLQIVNSNSLATKAPKLAKQWHPTRNKGLAPSQVGIGDERKVWWKCEKHDDHEWKASTNDRYSGLRHNSKNDGCPFCIGRRYSYSMSLKAKRPGLVKEWHIEKNKELSPEKIYYKKYVKVWWQCSKDKEHEWKADIGQRVNGSGCPYCTLTPQSRQELIITFELLKFFKNINPKGYKTRLNGKLRAIDIFIPDLNLAIEFDGSYWHKDKLALDKIKSEMLMDVGYQVIRIREQPLKKIHENDIVSKLPYNGKEITDNILKRILELYPVKGPLKQKIQNYISKDGLQNEKVLDNYIDQILEEKAAKKK